MRSAARGNHIVGALLLCSVLLLARPPGLAARSWSGQAPTAGPSEVDYDLLNGIPRGDDTEVNELRLDSAACGVAAAAMVLDFYWQKAGGIGVIPLRQVAKHVAHTLGGSYPDDIVAGIQAASEDPAFRMPRLVAQVQTLTTAANVLTTVGTEVKAGRPLIAFVPSQGTSYLGWGEFNIGHFIVISGVTPTDHVIYHDPWHGDAHVLDAATFAHALGPFWFPDPLARPGHPARWTPNVRWQGSQAFILMTPASVAGTINTPTPIPVASVSAQPSMNFGTALANSASSIQTAVGSVRTPQVSTPVPNAPTKEAIATPSAVTGVDLGVLAHRSASFTDALIEAIKKLIRPIAPLLNTSASASEARPTVASDLNVEDVPKSDTKAMPTVAPTSPTTTVIRPQPVSQLAAVSSRLVPMHVAIDEVGAAAGFKVVRMELGIENPDPIHPAQVKFAKDKEASIIVAEGRTYRAGVSLIYERSDSIMSQKPALQGCVGLPCYEGAPIFSFGLRQFLLPPKSTLCGVTSRSLESQDFGNMARWWPRAETLTVVGQVPLTTTPQSLAISGFAPVPIPAVPSVLRCGIDAAATQVVPTEWSIKPLASDSTAGAKVKILGLSDQCQNCVGNNRPFVDVRVQVENLDRFGYFVLKANVWAIDDRGIFRLSQVWPNRGGAGLVMNVGPLQTVEDTVLVEAPGLRWIMLQPTNLDQSWGGTFTLVARIRDDSAALAAVGSAPGEESASSTVSPSGAVTSAPSIASCPDDPHVIVQMIYDANPGMGNPRDVELWRRDVVVNLRFAPNAWHFVAPEDSMAVQFIVPRGAKITYNGGEATAGQIVPAGQKGMTLWLINGCQ